MSAAGSEEVEYAGDMNTVPNRRTEDKLAGHDS
jgi:hypothetical protein